MTKVRYRAARAAKNTVRKHKETQGSRRSVAKHRKRLNTEKYSEETQGNTGIEEKCGETQR